MAEIWEEYVKIQIYIRHLRVLFGEKVPSPEKLPTDVETDALEANFDYHSQNEAYQKYLSDSKKVHDGNDRIEEARTELRKAQAELAKLRESRPAQHGVTDRAALEKFQAGAGAATGLTGEHAAAVARYAELTQQRLDLKKEHAAEAKKEAALGLQFDSLHVKVDEQISARKAALPEPVTALKEDTEGRLDVLRVTVAGIVHKVTTQPNTVLGDVVQAIVSEGGGDPMGRVRAELAPHERSLANVIEVLGG